MQGRLFVVKEIGTTARLQRESGLDSIGAADIMKAAGMTHDGFYWHFESKDEVAVKASEQATAETTGVLIEKLSKQPSDPSQVLIKHYALS